MKTMIPIRISVRRKTAATSLSAVVCGASESSLSLMEVSGNYDDTKPNASLMEVHEEDDSDDDSNEVDSDEEEKN
ncbi:hypothetical protein L6452_18716 [Arctium lappa]|uniref:Uncharacterized protein n=2 Tax=Arctium lappa TaxID=4217 RepID=A0ACB9C766_ARCLA|nr:hypothetical protein L6452_18714 [Arctium lappa]KAI3730040.1 hypothetical protein L6452_18716 [Arctium lappa]